MNVFAWWSIIHIHDYVRREGARVRVLSGVTRRCDSASGLGATAASQDGEQRPAIDNLRDRFRQDM